MLALYGSVGVVAGLAQAVYLVAAFVLAAHLLGRVRRQWDLAPFLLGLNLLFAMGFGYLLCSVGMAAAMLVERSSPSLVAGLLGAGYSATIVGLAAAAVFQWRVFWPDRRWPLAVVLGLVGAMALGCVGYAVSGGLATGSYTGFWAWLLVTGMVATNLWVGIQPLLYYRKLQKRIPLGLAEPIVADRFLLWGFGSLARAAMIFLGPVSELALQRLGAESQLSYAAVILVVASLLGLATSVAYWLTFNPTRAYTRWVERRYRSPEAA
jgi:hypothetical protein